MLTKDLFAVALLQKGRLSLEPAFRDEAEALEREISAITSREEWRKWLARSRNTILIHAGFWVVLIFLYPVSGMVQAIFFWNPWIRRITGLGYVGFAVTWVPLLRRRLLAPFRDSLLADAGLHGFKESAYYARSFVRDKATGEYMPISEALPELRKQVVLTGESGLGKTMFLRHLAHSSNPMDLTVVGDMIARKQHPDIFHLQQQQYKMMAAESAIVNVGKPFPLKEFSKMVYEMRLVDQREIPSEQFGAELDCMEQFKMVLRRQESDGKRHWMFRHDKVMDFFIVQAFLGPENSRAVDHLADPRFRGAYFQLATLLFYHEALSLREKLVQYAADTKDHSVSDTFVQLLRPRQREAAATAS